MNTLRGLDALEDAINAIAGNPQGHKQSAWRCETGMCLAGYIAERNGGIWAHEPGGPEASFLVPLPGDAPENVRELAGGKPGVHVAERARQILGFFPELGDGGGERDLFGASNTLADLRDMLSGLRAAEASGALDRVVIFLPEVTR